jgi:hypothetical protein
MDSYQLMKWLGIFFCLSQSALFSGMNLAAFSITRLRLEVLVAAGDPLARKVLALRQDSNYLLTTILWGNVGINVLLTLLSDSVMAGILAFCFSTILITLVGEIIPQAYFSRHALFHRETDPLTHCHRPIIVHDPGTVLGDLLGQLKVDPQQPGDDVIDHDIILLWGDQRRVITGADILRRLMRGIITPDHPAPTDEPSAGSMLTQQKSRMV